MKVLITGADGMLGSHLCREALRQGYEVRAMVLPNSKITVLDELPLEKVFGNITDAQSMDQLVKGCDYVINAAASTQIWPRRSKQVWEVNLQGVKNLVTAAQNHQVKRFIQIGSASSFGHGSPEKPGNEETLYNSKAYNMDYVDSKQSAQTWLLKMHQDSNFPVIVINPTYMIGAFDSGPSSGKMVMSLLKGALPGYSSGMKNFVATKDVARASINSLEKGKLGNCYIAGNENLTFESFFKKACSVHGIKFKLKRIPDPIILLVGLINSIWARISGKAPKLGYNMAKQAIMKQCFNPTRARLELELPATPIEEALKDCINWWRENNYLN